jgi:hypothetical protein
MFAIETKNPISGRPLQRNSPYVYLKYHALNDLEHILAGMQDANQSTHF